jgi:hypothetical protein
MQIKRFLAANPRHAGTGRTQINANWKTRNEENDKNLLGQELKAIS